MNETGLPFPRCPLCDRDHLPGIDPADEGASSPCIMVCVLDATGVCLGCQRTDTEIADWHTMTPADRQATMHRVDERRRPPSGRVPEDTDPTPEAGLP